MQQESSVDGSLGSQSIISHTDIDNLEAALVREFPEEDAPVKHTFLPGIYIREILMRKGLCVTSKIHRTKHAFVILKGDVSVYSENEGVVRYKGPFQGVTLPGTRRILLIHEDTIWITFHPAEEKTVEEIEDRIIEKHDNPQLAYERLIKQLTQ